MTFRQATTTVIRTTDFRDNTFSFPVESMLGIGQGAGELSIETSEGYALTTPTNANPQSQQTIPYVLQPDGTRLASAVVTLLSINSSLSSGTVTLRNPLGETIVLPIDAETDANRPDTSPILILSTETLTFAKTEPGEEEYAILKVNQQGANTHITLTSDDPSHFLLAIGVQELRFTSTISFVPSSGGTFVHVRYAPNRSGQHTARLFVETSFDTKTILLRGRTTGLLSALPQSLPKPVRENQLVQVVKLPKPSQWLSLSVVLLLGGLAWVGYVYRCQLAPGLCQNEGLVTPATKPYTRLVEPPASGPAEKKLQDDNKDASVVKTTRLETKRKKTKEPIKLKTALPERNETITDSRSRKTLKKIADKGSVRPEKNGSANADPVRKPRGKSVLSPSSNPPVESDLEKVLNKKTEN